MNPFVKYHIFAATALVMSMTGITMAATLPGPVTDADYYNSGKPSQGKVDLGKSLFFDKILSGNKNISCATCHSPFLASGDGLSLGVGEGGQFIGPMRTTGNGTGNDIIGRIGRNAPPLFNLGAKEFVKLNWQGRHQVDAASPSGFSLPSGSFTPLGLENVLAGQALFPLLNSNEMMGHGGENEIISAAPLGTPPGPALFPPSWEALVKRLRGVPTYVDMFKTAFPDVTSSDKMTIVHVANALSAFQAKSFRADNSPFDRFLRGEVDALSAAQSRGKDLFYGKANCAGCHSGKFQTNHKFHSIAMPQFGPGVTANKAQPLEDIGRQEVTLKAADRFKFRTPPLRNVTYTAPYGHTGAYNSLEGVIRHHLDPVNSYNNWDNTQVVMPSDFDLDPNDFALRNDTVKSQAITATNELLPASLTDAEIKDIIDFLDSLTDPKSLDQRHLIPASVPSGLPVGD